MEDLIYLDYNATTHLAPEVIESIRECLHNAWANPSSSSLLGKKAKEYVNKARLQIAQMIKAAEDDIVFTSGGTEANNVVLHTVIKTYASSVNDAANRKPHIITTNVEHDAILLPLKNYEKEDKAEVTYVPVSKETGAISTSAIINAVQPNTCLVTVMLANNETGVIMPIKEIGKQIAEMNKSRENKIFYHTDAAQAFGKIPVDVDELGVDYLTIVGHKFYGPRIGALFVRALGKDTPLCPMFFGGGQERGYRPGTENTPMIAGLGTAARLVTENVYIYGQHMRAVRDYLELRLK